MGGRAVSWSEGRRKRQGRDRYRGGPGGLGGVVLVRRAGGRTSWGVLVSSWAEETGSLGGRARRGHGGGGGFWAERRRQRKELLAWHDGISDMVRSTIIQSFLYLFYHI